MKKFISCFNSNNIKIILTLRNQQDLFYSIYYEAYSDNLSDYKELNKIENYWQLIKKSNKLDFFHIYLFLKRINKIQEVYVNRYEDFLKNKHTFISDLSKYINEDPFKFQRVSKVNSKQNKLKNKISDNGNSLHTIIFKLKFSLFGNKKFNLNLLRFIPNFYFPFSKKTHLICNNLKDEISIHYSHSNKKISKYLKFKLPPKTL